MKKLLLLLFSVMISFNSYGEWKKLDALSVSGITHYIDNLTIKKHDGYVYFWMMIDIIEPTSGDGFSSKIYVQCDCGLVRFKILSQIDYLYPMGRGSSVDAYNPPNRKWVYPPPDDKFLDYICDYVD
jgi:hypothetical protein